MARILLWIFCLLAVLFSMFAIGLAILAMIQRKSFAISLLGLILAGICTPFLILMLRYVITFGDDKENKL